MKILLEQFAEEVTETKSAAQTDPTILGVNFAMEHFSLTNLSSKMVQAFRSRQDWTQAAPALHPGDPGRWC